MRKVIRWFQRPSAAGEDAEEVEFATSAAEVADENKVVIAALKALRHPKSSSP